MLRDPPAGGVANAKVAEADAAGRLAQAVGNGKGLPRLVDRDDIAVRIQQRDMRRQRIEYRGMPGALEVAQLVLRATQEERAPLRVQQHVHLSCRQLLQASLRPLQRVDQLGDLGRSRRQVRCSPDFMPPGYRASGFAVS